MDELDTAIRTFYISLGIECLNCNSRINANDCVVEETGRIICPNCKEDICGE